LFLDKIPIARNILNDMCQDCGCSAAGTAAHSPQPEGIVASPFPHHHGHQTLTITPDRQSITIGQGILSKNNHLAHHNRELFQSKGVMAMNWLSSPGAGKTSLIQRMIGDRRTTHPTAVIVGDLATDNDAQRLRSAGAIAIQVTTGNICHLEAAMVAKACGQINLEAFTDLIIENVGNLVCPAAYDLGESLRVVLFSVTEGEDKPLKYPATFKSAHAILITKMDIAAAVDFDRELARHNLQQVAPQAHIFEVSARTGQGVSAWYEYLESQRPLFPSVLLNTDK
jgi:hydrogenase nickel incorporation protein HypB